MIERTITSNDIAIKALKDAGELANLTATYSLTNDLQLKVATFEEIRRILRNIKQAIEMLESQAPGSVAGQYDGHAENNPPFSKEHGEIVGVGGLAIFCVFGGLLIVLVKCAIESWF